MAAELAILCVSEDQSAAERVVKDLEAWCGGRVAVRGGENGSDRGGEGSARVAVVVMLEPMGQGGGAGLGPAAKPRVVVVGGKEGVGDALLPGDAVLPGDASPERILHVVREQLTMFVTQSAVEHVEPLGDLLDARILAAALARAEASRRASESQLRSGRRGFLADRDLRDETVEQAMLASMQSAVGHLPRQQLPAGSTLLEEDKPMEGVYIVLSGQVELTRRGMDREVIFHSRTTGPIVGLMALAQRRRAFFTCRAVTDVTAIPVTWQQLDEALQSDPVLSLHFVTVLVRSMATRLRRIAELQIEVDSLNTALAEERDQLAAALQQLEGAQGRLVQSEKMATLGQLSAGVAHELNNPITAIRRGADHLAGDLAVLVEELPDGRSMRAMLERALMSAPLPTAQMRRLRFELGRELGDEDLARRLVDIGISSRESIAEWIGRLGGHEREQRLHRLERAYQLGLSLRSLRTSSERVTAIVKSLRSYARHDESPTDNVDLHEGLEDTLLLFGSSLRGVEVVREYGDLPRIACRPGEINQVWTNLISNAIEAMEGRGRLSITTDAPDAGHVRVRFADSGPGIPPENLDRVFELNFTTKHGRTRFGLGMGLLICRQIVERHGGSITIDSRPGQTAVTVTLPVQCPAIPGEAGAAGAGRRGITNDE
jgi:two-component system, NtrC family, sensor kinase